MPTPEKKPTTPEPVTLPDWFEQYRDLIAETGGNEIEDLLTDLRDQKRILRTNMPRGVLAFMAHAQVGLLHRLHERNLLAAPFNNSPGWIGPQRAEELARDEGPTPQQEMDWAIHNDHADEPEIEPGSQIG